MQVNLSYTKMTQMMGDIRDARSHALGTNPLVPTIAVGIGLISGFTIHSVVQNILLTPA